MRFNIASKSAPTSDLDELVLPKPKLLKSCIRCRKHKIKCDAAKNSPHPCTSCQKKNIQCRFDYVLPPQRSDNLKDLMSQVDSIKQEVEMLSRQYSNLSRGLKLEIPGFEIWKMEQQRSILNSAESWSEKEENLNLIKLSNGSFVSMNLHLNSNCLIVEQEHISITEFQTKLNRLSSRLRLLTSFFDYGTNAHSNDWLDMGFSIHEMFKSSKLQLLILVKFFYPHVKFNFDRLINDYLSSYYNTIHQLNDSLNTSTYSSNLNILLLNKSSNNLIKTNHLESTQVIIFNRVQLCALLNAEIFNSEVFLKKLLQLLFLNFCVNGHEELKHLNELIEFIKNNINNKRKRLNFDKNPDLKFIENFADMINLLSTAQDIPNFDSSTTTRSFVPDKRSSFFNFHGIIVQLIEFQKYQSSTLIPANIRESTSSVNIKEECQVNSIPTLFQSSIVKEDPTDKSKKLPFAKKCPRINLFSVESLRTDFLRLIRRLDYFISSDVQQVESNSELAFFDSFLIEISLLTFQILKRFEHEFEIHGSQQQDQHPDSQVPILYQKFLNQIQSLNIVPITNNYPSTYSFSLPFLTSLHQSIQTFRPKLMVKLEHDDSPYHEETVQHNGLISPVLMETTTSSSSMASDSPNSIVGLSVTDVSSVYDNTSRGVCFGNNDEIQVILESVDWKKETTDDVLKKIGLAI